MADDISDGPPPPDDPAIGTQDRILAGILLLGSLMLAYICMDVLADGAITRKLRRGDAA